MADNQPQGRLRVGAPNFRNCGLPNNRLGKPDESQLLWEEAAKRYEDLDAAIGVAESAAWLTIFATEQNNLELAGSWYKKAKKSADLSNDGATFTFIDEVKKRLDAAQA